MNRRLAIGLIIVISVFDIPWFLGLQRILNTRLIAEGAGRILVLFPDKILMLELIQVFLVFIATVLLGGRKLAKERSFGLAGTKILICFLLFRAIFMLFQWFSAPSDRVRLLISASRVAKVSGLLDDSRRSHSGFPDDLMSLDIPRSELYDGWGFRLDYSRDQDGGGYRLFAPGVPKRLEWMKSKYERCFVTFRSDPTGGSRGDP